jgi:exocyst complex component 2
MRDYKKGKFLLESKPGQLLPLPSATGSGSQSTASTTSEQQKRIFDKVWNAVEKVMEDMRVTLLAQLKEPSRTVDEQEKTIEYVVD